MGKHNKYGAGAWLLEIPKAAGGTRKSEAEDLHKDRTAGVPRVRDRVMQCLQDFSVRRGSRVRNQRRQSRNARNVISLDRRGHETARASIADMLASYSAFMILFQSYENNLLTLSKHISFSILPKPNEIISQT